MFHIIYKTTNTVNNKIYIGYHFQESDPHQFDGYLGSGDKLLRAIRKYGSDKFYRETLYVFDTEQVALEKESEIVNESFIKRNDVYNITVGGGLPPSQKGIPKSDSHKQKIGISQKGKIVAETTKTKISQSLTGTKRGKRDPVTVSKISESLKGHRHNESSKQKMSDNHWDCAGENNPCFGKTGSEHPAFGTKRKLINCPHCLEDVPVNVAERWHFDNCRSKITKS